MTEQREGPPYRWAGAVFLTTLALYVATLGPTTQFWDAAEYMTAAHSLGIPHPPGNPLFVIMAHVWGLLPLAADYGARINLFAAATSAASAALWFLIGERWLRPMVASRPARLVWAATGALVGATTFTVWNQSVANEKVYTISVFTIAVVLWLGIRWSDHDDQERPDRLLVVIAYLLMLTSANHQMGLLAAPAVLALVIMTDRFVLGRPRVIGWALAAVVAATSVYAFLPIRARRDPYLNQGAVSTWPALKAHLSRAQFAKPSVFSDPRYQEGPTNPGRSPRLFGQQMQNYAQYFMWQWGHDLNDGLQRALAVVFAFLGLVGAHAHWRAERRQAIAMTTLVLTLTIGLVFYLNFKTGYSQDIGQAQVVREVRERDYFFIASFSAWGVWVGMGLAAIASWIVGATQAGGGGRGGAQSWRWALVAPVLALAFVPLVANRVTAPRSHETLARAYGQDLLQSLDPYAIVVTAGDNDTFPLWYAQEVGGVRRDVTVMVTSLANLSWYLRQMNQRAVPPFDPTTAPAWYRSGSWPRPEQPWMGNIYRGTADTLPEFVVVDSPVTGRLGPINVALDPAQLPVSGILTRVDLALLQLIKENLGRRPIYFAGTTASYPDQLGLGPYLVTQGMVRELKTSVVVPDSTVQLSRVQGRYIDVPRTTALGFEVYHRAEAARRRPQGWVDKPSQNILLPYILTFDTIAEVTRDSNPARSREALSLATAMLANTTYQFDLTPPSR